MLAFDVVLDGERWVIETVLEVHEAILKERIRGMRRRYAAESMPITPELAELIRYLDRSY